MTKILSIITAAGICWAAVLWLSRVGWLAQAGALVLTVLFVRTLFDLANEMEMPESNAVRADRAIRHVVFAIVGFFAFVGLTLCLGQ